MRQEHIDQVWDHVSNQVQYHIDQVWDHVSNQVQYQVWDQVRDQLGNQSNFRLS